LKPATILDGITLPDTAAYTETGRRLLVALGVVERDPLRVQAERWLAEHTGCKTPATRRVREALGDPWPDEFLEAAEKFKNTLWKGPIA
jgi:hypothetical protein